MEQAYRIYEGKGNLVLKIYQDELSESPREWDNLGTMVCWHRRYNLGDKHEFSTPDDFQNFWKKQKGIILPLYLYDHSGITISTSHEYPYNDRWDAGQVGWIYITNEKIKEEYSVKTISSSLKKRVTSYLEGEVETYDQYLTGDVFGFKLMKKTHCDKCNHDDEVELDSCWGFYGDDPKENGMQGHLGKDIVSMFDFD